MSIYSRIETRNGLYMALDVKLAVVDSDAEWSEMDCLGGSDHGLLLAYPQ
jgi:hypothetical protein